MKTVSRILFMLLSFAITISAYAHPGHSHAELNWGELFVHTLAWGGLIATLITGIWILNRIHTQRSHDRHLKIKLPIIHTLIKQ